MRGISQMIISTKAIVSNSEMIKNYKSCREKTEVFGKIFILKNNQLDAVLFSIKEYERVSAIIEYLESLDDEGIKLIYDNLAKESDKKAAQIPL